MTSELPGGRRRPGPKAETLKIDLPFEEAVKRAMRAGKPQDRETVKPERRGKRDGAR